MFFMNGGQIHSNGIRPTGFNAAVYQALGHPLPGQNVCHYISINLIESWMDEIRLASPALAVDLTALANAVFVGNIPAAVNASITAVAGGPTVANLNTLLVQLHNAIPNLRIGDSSWNQGIGSCYDPGAWVHYNAAGTIDSSVNGPGPSAWLGGPPAPAAPASAFYLCSANNNIQINLVHQINNAVSDMEILSNAGHLPNGNPIQFIQSSDNANYTLNPQQLQVGDPIFYYDTAAAAWMLI